jgi:hypothetical protein
LPRRRDCGRQHAVDHGDVEAHLIERIARIEGDLRAGHASHQPVRVFLEGDTDFRIRAAPIAGHLEPQLLRGVARLTGGEHRHLVAAAVEHRRGGEHRSTLPPGAQVITSTRTTAANQTDATDCESQPSLPQSRCASTFTSEALAWTPSERVADRSAHACFARAKHERDLGSARRVDVVRGASLRK